METKSIFFRTWHLFLISAISLQSAHSQDIRWEKSYGGKHAEYLLDVQPTADYGFILAGSSISGKTGNKTAGNNGDLDYWIWKMDEHGEPVWQKSFGGTSFDLLHSIRMTSDGGSILAGSSQSPKGMDKKEDSRGDNDFWVIKLDAGGGEQWQKTIGGAGSDELTNVLPLRDGGYLLGGTSSSSAIFDIQNQLIGEKSEKSRGSSDYWIVKLDGAGKIEWQKTYGGQFADQLRSMHATTDGGAIVGGWSNSPASGDKTTDLHGMGDFWILKLDKDGVIEWQKSFGGDKDDDLRVVLQTADGNYIAAGNSNSGSSGSRSASSSKGSDFWIIKMDELGNSVWQQGYDYGENDILSSVIENPDGSLLVGGFAKGESATGKDKESINDYIAMKLSPTGEKLWDRTVGSDGDDVLRKAIMTRDGGYLLAGTSNPQSPGRAGRSKVAPLVTDNTSRPAGVQQVQDGINHAKQDAINSVNDYYKENATAVTDRVNDAVGKKDSPLQFGLNAPTDILSGGADASKSLDALGEMAGGGKKMPASRDKKSNLGGSDFWVVKLKDKVKKEEIKQKIEAIPNPAKDYTNVIVGYDFKSGTATLYDLSGRQLQSFPITTGRTVPVSLSGLPIGIYIVEIKTEISTDSVKVMKSR